MKLTNIYFKEKNGKIYLNGNINDKKIAVEVFDKDKNKHKTWKDIKEEIYKKTGVKNIEKSQNIRFNSSFFIKEKYKLINLKNILENIKNKIKNDKNFSKSKKSSILNFIEEIEKNYIDKISRLTPRTENDIKHALNTLFYYLDKYYEELLNTDINLKFQELRLNDGNIDNIPEKEILKIVEDYKEFLQENINIDVEELEKLEEQICIMEENSGNINKIMEMEDEKLYIEDEIRINNYILDFLNSLEQIKKENTEIYIQFINNIKNILKEYIKNGKVKLKNNTIIYSKDNFIQELDQELETSNKIIGEIKKYDMQYFEIIKEKQENLSLN